LGAASDFSKPPLTLMRCILAVAIHEGGLAQSLVEPDAVPSGALERTYLPTVLRAVFRDGERTRVTAEKRRRVAT
jgi:hypothetical protein